MKSTGNKNIGELFNDSEGMERALKEAVRKALLQHKRAGNPVVTWRNGKVVWVEPKDIDVEEEYELKNIETGLTQ